MAVTINEGPTRMSEAERIKQLRPFIGCPVELLAGPDDLTADCGVFLFIRAGDGDTEPAAVVEFNRNGRWAIPFSMLYVPDYDHVRRETTAFIIAGRSISERQQMGVSFELVCNSTSRDHARGQFQSHNDDNDMQERKTCSCEYFGNCPDCRKQFRQNGGGYLNVRRHHWGYCQLHKTKWHIGENVFSSWEYESEDDWQCNADLLESAVEVEPWFCDACAAQQH